MALTNPRGRLLPRTPRAMATQTFTATLGDQYTALVAGGLAEDEAALIVDTLLATTIAQKRLWRCGSYREPTAAEVDAVLQEM